jgi:hypothetical protein
MSEFDFAAQPPRREEEDAAGSAFAPPAAKKGDGKAHFKSGKEKLKSDPKLQQSGASATQAQDSMATLVGMAGHAFPHVPTVDSATGLAGLLKTPIAGMMQTSDDQKYSLDLNKSSSPGGHISGTKTGLGTASAAPQDAAKVNANSQAMSAIGNLSGAMGSGMASSLAQSGDLVRQQLAWLSPAAKELYNFERK